MTPLSDSNPPRLVPPPPSESSYMTPRGRRLLWISMIVGIVVAGAAFVFKIVEFALTLGDRSVDGFADVPVTVYFFVAAGWLAVLIWCFTTGKFKNIEQPKYDMLAREEEYDRRGE